MDDFDTLLKNSQINCDHWRSLDRSVTEVDSNHVLNVNNYLQDGFVPVCKVQHDILLSDGTYGWRYVESDLSLLFSEHRSWVYFVVVDNAIVKVGQTGLRLGIPYDVVAPENDRDQPICGTTNRFGRMRRQFNKPGQREDTDSRNRKLLQSCVEEGRVTLWAKACPITLYEVTVQGINTVVEKTMNVDLETIILDHIQRDWGRYPVLNVCRK
jgi:hypothetical protein